MPYGANIVVGNRSLTKAEYELVENSSVLFQEIVALLLGSESIRHIDLSNVLGNMPTSPSENGQYSPGPMSRECEVIPPIVLLWKSLQTRCNSINLSGNRLGVSDIAGLCKYSAEVMVTRLDGLTIHTARVLQKRPGFLKKMSVSNCHLDENALAILWEGLHEQHSTLEVLDLSHNLGRIEAIKASETLNESSRLRCLNLAYSIKGNLDGPLFKPWSTGSSLEPWRLEELDLSGWKVRDQRGCKSPWGSC